MNDEQRCLELWSAVLLMAIRDLTDPQDCGDTTPERRIQRRERIMRDSRYWFESRSAEPGSFEWVCGLYHDTNADAIRERLGVALCHGGSAGVTSTKKGQEDKTGHMSTSQISPASIYRPREMQWLGSDISKRVRSVRSVLSKNDCQCPDTTIYRASRREAGK